MRQTRYLSAFAALILCLTLALLNFGAAGGAVAQTVAPPVTGSTQAPDFAAWEADAKTAEEVIAAARASSKAMEDMRSRIDAWRSKFDAAKSTNAPQIETLKNQIAALGAPPAAGTDETPEIAQRRRDLNETMARLQSPVLAAVEAFSRAEGIIRQIDALIRARQASALLLLLPSPANPLHWPSAAAVLSQGVNTLWDEVEAAWVNPARQVELRNNLPVIIGLVLVAVLLLLRGRRFMERLSQRLQRRTTLRARSMIVAVVSLGQIALPVLGMVFLVAAVLQSGMTGPRLEALVSALVPAAFGFFAARWLATWLFPNEQLIDGMRLTDRPAEARLHMTLIGLFVAAEDFRTAFTTDVRPPLSQAAQAVWLAPMVCIVAIFLFRLGVLLRRAPLPGVGTSADAQQFRNKIVSFVGIAMVAVALAAPLLALVGYVAAANALIWPAIGSAGLAGIMLLLQRFLTDIYVVITKSGDDGREALIPVLVGFSLALVSLPMFALIWGARATDLSEAWARFQTGVSLGGVQVSPTAVLTLIVVFAFGYVITRLLQGAMRSVVMPRTRLDKGAQTAAISGLGYVGIIVSALAAITAAGINLSALAIVAGALSVGIGFGLQNIVQNFISGIILLIERPITEGDTIEVGGKAGVVRSISVRSTSIMTADQAEVVIPNAEFISGMVTNWTRDSLKGRLVMPVTVAYGSDTRKVEAILREIVNAQPLVLIDPAPSVFLMGFAQQGLTYEIRAILSDLNFKLNVQSEINHQIIARFDEASIEIPLGYQELVLRRHDEFEAELADRRRRSRKPRPAAAPTPADLPPVHAGSINNDPANDPDEDEEAR